MQCLYFFSKIVNVGHGLAMMREVADTPGSFAIAGVQDIFAEKCPL
ncbi:hypothetical protein [Brevibacillus laterosporus]|nr:hypothetical protein [Brevibacillus laterosporus]CCF16416.1 hypothetical protein BLGI_4385 [Brevibacillus laterosporus GI-9]